MRENLLTLLDDFEKCGSQTALAHRRGLRIQRWSYERLRKTVFQVARELEQRGISKGDRVLFWAENSPEWVAAFFGCLLRGVIVVPLDFESSPEFAARVQAQVKAKLILQSGNLKTTLEPGLQSLTIDELSTSVARHTAERYTASHIIDSDIAEIIFTSGT